MRNEEKEEQPEKYEDKKQKELRNEETEEQVEEDEDGKQKQKELKSEEEEDLRSIGEHRENRTAASRTAEGSEEQRGAEKSREEQRGAESSREQHRAAESSREERGEREEREVKRLREEREEERRAQEGRERQEQEVKVQGEHGEEERGWTQKECVGEKEKERRKSTYEDNDVSNRHMARWKRSWIRIDVGSSMRSARGRRRVWRAARRVADEARDGEGVGEAQRQSEEAEGGEIGKEKGRETDQTTK